MVYIDILALEDLVLNYIVLLAVSIILNRITKLKKIFLASVIGLIPLVFLLLNIGKMLLLLIIFIFGLIMSIIAFDYKDIIYTIKNVLYMYFVSIFLAGTIYLINTHMLPKIDNYLLNTIILLILAPIITYIYIRSINLIKTNYSNYYLVDIYFKDKPMITINTFLDTGNHLKDPYHHRPIILISRDIVELTTEKFLLVPYNTIDNTGLILCFKPEKIYIHNVGYRKRVLLGLTDRVPIDGADGILNKELLERI